MKLGFNGGGGVGGGGETKMSFNTSGGSGDGGEGGEQHPALASTSAKRRGQPSLMTRGRRRGGGDDVLLTPQKDYSNQAQVASPIV